jgi:hypothetical protein
MKFAEANEEPDADYSGVTATAGSYAELQMLLLGITAKYPELDPERLRARPIDAQTVQIFVSKRGSGGEE